MEVCIPIGGRARPAARACLCGFALALAAAAQPLILHGPVIDAVTYSSARLTWITDVPATKKVQWGLTGAYTLTASRNEKHTTQSWFLSGLAPGTTYHFRVCSTANEAERCSGDYSLTTARAPASIPAPPEPPRRQVDTSLPAGSYGEPFLVAPDCSNLPSILAAIATLEDDLNYEIRLSAGTVCTGQFIFPQRPKHRGWVVVKTADEAGLPPDVRVPAEATTAMAVFRTDALPRRSLLPAYFGTSCYPGTLLWGATVPGLALFICEPQGDSSGAKPIFRANWEGDGPVVVTVGAHGYKTGNLVRISGTGLKADNQTWRITVIDEHNFSLDGSRGGGTPTGAGTATRNDAWTQVPHTAGTELPPACAPNEWFFRPDVTPATRALYWCTAPNQWTQIRPIENPDAIAGAAIQFAEGAARYRFIGLEVTHIPTPTPPPPGWERRDYKQGAFGALVATLPSNDRIIFDRCDIHGLDYPSRVGFGFYLDGSNVALINSRVHKINHWTEQADGVNLEATALNIAYGPGPGKIENNFLEAIGITLFFPDSNLQAPPADYVIRRNYFSHPDKYLYGSPFNTSGKNYMNRQLIELKGGQRMLVEGNIFDGNWMDVTQGAMILLTPRTTPARAQKKITRIQDGVVTVSAAQDPYAPGLLVYLSNTGTANYDGLWEVEEVLSPLEFKLKNAPAGSAAAGACIAASSTNQISDIDIRNNLFRYGPNLLWITGHHDGGGTPWTTKTTQRVRLMNNLVYRMDSRAAAAGGRASPIGANRGGRTGITAFSALGLEDLIIRNNTIYDSRGSPPVFLFLDTSTPVPSAGLEVRDNIFTASAPDIAWSGGGIYGVTALNNQWAQHPQPAWTLTNNLFCCQVSGDPPGRQPPRNVYLDAVEKIGFVNPATGDFRLSSTSPFRAGEKCFEAPGDCTSTGRDMGVNFEELLAALGDPLPPLVALHQPARQPLKPGRGRPASSPPRATAFRGTRVPRPRPK